MEHSAPGHLRRRAAQAAADALAPHDERIREGIETGGSVTLEVEGPTSSLTVAP